MSEKHLEKCLTSITMREMKIKMTSRFCLVPDRMAKIRNTIDSLCWRGCGILLHAGGSVNLYSHFGNQYGGFSENWESVYHKTQLCNS